MTTKLENLKIGANNKIDLKLRIVKTYPVKKTKKGNSFMVCEAVDFDDPKTTGMRLDLWDKHIGNIKVGSIMTVDRLFLKRVKYEDKDYVMGSIGVYGKIKVEK